MSTSLLRIIPEDPDHVPSLSAQIRARTTLAKLVPNAGRVHSEVHNDPAFIDQGENFEEVRCGSCGKPLGTAHGRTRAREIARLRAFGTQPYDFEIGLGISADHH